MELKFRSKSNHEFTNHSYLHSAVWKDLYIFKISRAQDITKFSFKMFKIINIWDFQDVQKQQLNWRWLNKKQKLVVLRLTVLFSTENTFFGVNLVQKFKIVNVSWNLSLILMQVYRSLRWYSIFLFLTGKYILGKFGQKTQGC